MQDGTHGAMTQRGRRTLWVAGAAVAAVLAYAWFDGGERALEPIVVPVEVPEGAQ